MRLIDADKFLAHLIYSGLINDAKCGNIVEAVEKCEVKAIPLDKVEQIREEINKLSPTPTAEDVIDGNAVKDAIWETLIEVDKIIDKAIKEQNE